MIITWREIMADRTRALIGYEQDQRRALCSRNDYRLIRDYTNLEKHKGSFKDQGLFFSISSMVISWKTPIFHYFTCQVVIGQFNKPITFKFVEVK